MITYTFKANVDFFIFVDKYKTEYNSMDKMIGELMAKELKLHNWPVGENTFIDMSTGEQYWVTERRWPSLDFFLKVTDIVANNFTDSMIEYLENNNVVRYIQIVDALGTTLFPKTRVPNIRGQKYTNWINNILAQQQALG